jgi:hypothetical protein
MSRIRLFVSHSHRDKALADALQVLLAGVFGNAIEIDYSSDDAPGGGIRAGGTWLEWIKAAVRRTDVCIVILTEDSAGAPWVTWETGAVTGVAVGSEKPSDRAAPSIRVVPLIFGIDVDRVPAPLQQQQAVSGESRTGVRKLLFMLQERCGGKTLDHKSTQKSVSAFVEAVGRFMESRALEHPARLQAADASAMHLLNCTLGRTLEPLDGEIANGVRLQCGPFSGDAHQRWLLFPVDAGIYRITTFDRSKCLSIENDVKRAGAPVILWDYVGHQSQHWKLEKASGAAGVLSTMRIVNVHSGCVLSSAAAGNAVVQTKVENVTNEDWWMLLEGKI